MFARWLVCVFVTHFHRQWRISIATQQTLMGQIAMVGGAELCRS